MKKLLLFGGTTEGRLLAQDATELGFNVTVCVATEYGRDCLPPDHFDVRTGRLTEGEMVDLMGEDYLAVLDATHPYAVVVSQNIRTACQQAGLPYLRFLRDECGDNTCKYANSILEACKVTGEGNVLFATGSKEISTATALPDYKKRVYARVLPLQSSLDACYAIELQDDHILAGKGPFSTDENVETMKKHNITTMITKDSGAKGGFPEKIEAARACNVKVIVVRRPEEVGHTYQEILKKLEDLP
ncbi:MAG: precorrin-6A reductase [Eubacteriales bacterium]